MATAKRKKKRTPKVTPAMEAAFKFRETLLKRADLMVAGTFPAWHGWAIVDAFVEGAKWQRKQKP